MWSSLRRLGGPSAVVAAALLHEPARTHSVRPDSVADWKNWQKGDTPASCGAHTWSKTAEAITASLKAEIPMGVSELVAHKCRDCRAANALQATKAMSIDPLVDYDFVVNVTERKLDGVAYFSGFCEGPPGAAHGGMVRGACRKRATCTSP